MIGNAMGSQLPMAWFGAISSIVNLCYIVFLLFLPRSPYFYVHRNDLDEAKKTIQWYRRKLNVAEELEIIQTFVQSSKATTFVDKLKKMTERKNRNMLVLVLMLFIIMQLSGLHSVVFYMEIIVTKAKVTAMRPPDVVVLSGVFGTLRFAESPYDDAPENSVEANNVYTRRIRVRRKDNIESDKAF